MALNDKQVFGHIEELVEEEERLYGHEKLTHEDRERLDVVKVELDRCWDLLRQRRALRDAGQDPDKAKLRDASTVENYQQ